jgi:uncharacterized protein with PQ loop repeat
MLWQKYPRVAGQAREEKWKKKNAINKPSNQVLSKLTWSFFSILINSIDGYQLRRLQMLKKSEGDKSTWSFFSILINNIDGYQLRRSQMLKK